MTARALTAEDVAAEFGRSRTWIYDNWRQLVAEKRLPPPLQEAGHLVWSAAQVYAFLDKDLPPKLRALTAAHRAAEEAAARATTETVMTGEGIEFARAELDARFLGDLKRTAGERGAHGEVGQKPRGGAARERERAS